MVRTTQGGRDQGMSGKADRGLVSAPIGTESAAGLLYLSQFMPQATGVDRPYHGQLRCSAVCPIRYGCLLVEVENCCILPGIARRHGQMQGKRGLA